MGNHCVCIQEVESPTASEARRSKPTRRSNRGDGAGKKPKERNNPKCVEAMISDINKGVSSIPCHGGASWEFLPGQMKKNSGLMSGNDIEKIAFRLSSPHQLKRLELVSRGFGDTGAAALAQALKSPPCQSLTYLSLSHNNVTDDGFQELADALKENSSLRQLHCDGNLLGSDAVTALGCCLRVNRGLETVEVCIGCKAEPISSVSARALGAGLSSNATLKSLTLSGERARSRQGDRVARILKPEDFGDLFSRLNDNNTLQELRLRYLLGTDGPGVQAAAAQCAAFLLQTRFLRTLDLTGNIMGDAGGEALSTALASPSSLTFLNLSRNRFGTPALKALGKALATNASLVKLDLSHQYQLHSIDQEERPPVPDARDGIRAMISGLFSNRTLESLHVVDVSLDQELAKEATKMLQLCTSLTDLRHAETDEKATLEIGKLLQQNSERKTTQAAANLVARASAHSRATAQTFSAPKTDSPACGKNGATHPDDEQQVPELAWRADAESDGSSGGCVAATKNNEHEFVDVTFDDQDCYQ